MENPSGNDEPHNANGANDLSRSFAPLLPRSAADVASFLTEAAYALGEREADLARILGVSRATLSGWKARGAIPKAHLDWFIEEFAVAVLTGTAPKQHEGFRHAGIELALALFDQTDFDPFGVAKKDRRSRVEICFSNLGGLSRLALFVMQRQTETLDHLDESNVAILQALAVDAAPRLRFR